MVEGISTEDRIVEVFEEDRIVEKSEFEGVSAEDRIVEEKTDEGLGLNISDESGAIDGDDVTKGGADIRCFFSSSTLFLDEPTLDSKISTLRVKLHTSGTTSDISSNISH